VNRPTSLSASARQRPWPESGRVIVHQRVDALRFRAGLLGSLLALGCIEVTIPADDTGSGRQPPGGQPRVTPGTPTSPSDDVSVAVGPGLDLIASGARADATGVIADCATHCDCDLGQDCINGRCVTGALSIYCCDAAACPIGADCWSESGSPGTCSEGGPP